MVDNAVIVGVTGIVVSGVIGPTVAAWLARRARSRDFHREQVAHRRDELRKLLDEAASLLAGGPTMIRLLHAQRDQADVEEAEAWLAQVFPIGQRLQLWLAADHPVVTSYEQVRERLIDATTAGAVPAADPVLAQFEGERRSFLDHAREALMSPIPETGTGL